MDDFRGTKSFELGDGSTSDVIIRLRNQGGKPELYYSHSSILITKSKFFADRLSRSSTASCIEITCSDSDYEYHVELLKRLYLSDESLVDSWVSVESTLGILQLALAFNCEGIAKSCIQYLEAVPWEDKEEELILKTVPKLGPMAMPILSRIQPVDLNATKNVFISAIRFATSVDSPSPPFGDELKTSAQEQVEYMLGDDEEIPLVTTDGEVKAEVKQGFLRIFTLFNKQLSSLLSDSGEDAENRVMQSVSDLEWICSLLQKVDLMKDFVTSWVAESSSLIHVLEDKKLDLGMWDLKVKLIELTGKVLEAVGYGNVILPPSFRVNLLKAWLPYVRKMKPILDSMEKMDEDSWQNIEGAILALLSALPSNDQADILADWMSNVDELNFPNLSEAFEVWCYRTKSAKRRLMGCLDRVGNATISQ